MVSQHRAQSTTLEMRHTHKLTTTATTWNTRLGCLGNQLYRQHRRVSERRRRTVAATASGHARDALHTRAYLRTTSDPRTETPVANNELPKFPGLTISHNIEAK